MTDLPNFELRRCALVVCIGLLTLNSTMAADKKAVAKGAEGIPVAEITSAFIDDAIRKHIELTKAPKIKAALSILRDHGTLEQKRSYVLGRGNYYLPDDLLAKWGRNAGLTRESTCNPRRCWVEWDCPDPPPMRCHPRAVCDPTPAPCDP
jgi:hypothetical protein